ncbi:MAG: 5-methylcytosine-specific restriction endonuclease system specificity protein McrC [Proteobacteria bacterium]|nr:5-methylcytosine-specific restriction endonuclease system specificity protein McrC [Pseudomonadota bacterium]
MLMYASDLAAFGERFDGVVEGSADLPELLARLLAWVVERRLRQNLSRAYESRVAVLQRVRGRIDWLRTEAGRHLDRGQVVCRFEELTCDTARNRLVRAALEQMALRVSSRDVQRRCRRLARHLEELGVRAGRPSRIELARDQIARHDADDRVMVKVAELALDEVLPSETQGGVSATRLDRDEALLRRIFEKAVAGFYRYELHARDGWTVSPQKALSWNVAKQSAGLKAFLPGMNADVLLQRALPSGDAYRLIVETKFTNALTKNLYRKEIFKSAHLYQLYAYLQTQSGRSDVSADTARGLLLYPVVNQHIDEWAMIQGHRIRLATIDLAGTRDALRARLLELAL